MLSFREPIYRLLFEQIGLMYFLTYIQPKNRIIHFIIDINYECGICQGTHILSPTHTS